MGINGERERERERECLLCNYLFESFQVINSSAGISLSSIISIISILWTVGSWTGRGVCWPDLLLVFGK